MEKINIAELLKDCPIGMELDCTIFNGKVYFEGFDNNTAYPLKISINLVNIEHLDIYGQYNTRDYAKCVIFPKGKTTWEGFQRPFKDGEIVVFDDPHRDNLQVFIFKNKKENNTLSSCYLMLDGDELDLEEGMYCVTRLATEEEKQKLFKAIKEHGYRWNPETKTLEELPKFKVDDKIKLKGGDEFGIITQVADCFYTIKNKNNTHCWPIKKQDDWELVPNKFDINTLVPFESKVLVREDKTDVWRPTFYGFFHQHSKRFYTTSSGTWLMCIPYNKNTKHLTGTTDDCDNFYKTWKE